jgi:hypothetical protein
MYNSYDKSISNLMSKFGCVKKKIKIMLLFFSKKKTLNKILANKCNMIIKKKLVI